MALLSRRVCLVAALFTLVSARSVLLPAPAPSPEYDRYAPRSKEIIWEPCKGQGGECGRFEVPLDWSNESAGKASLYFVRYKAPSEFEKLGTLFLNPGGPGLSGVDFLHKHQDVMMTVSGNQYDLISWDPRGVGLTYPQAKCFEDAQKESKFWRGTAIHKGFEVREGFSDQADIDALYAQSEAIDSQLLKLGQNCATTSCGTLQYLGTMATVRDMIALHDILEGPDSPINFWGFSYGTVIGSYFINKFPERVGRVILDSVVDPNYHASVHPHKSWGISLGSAEEALTNFLKACAANADGCPFADTYKCTAESLRQKLWKAITNSYKDKDSSSSHLRDLVFDKLLKPGQWQCLAGELEREHSHSKHVKDSYKGSPLSWSSVSPVVDSLLVEQKPKPAPLYAIQAITCADAVDPGNVTTRMVLEELVRVTKEVSPVFGPLWKQAGFYCHKWPVRAVERYAGPWNVALKAPILVIGNVVDPRTPFDSARAVAKTLGNSARLLVRNNTGHSFQSTRSDCTTEALKSYLLHGTIPQLNTLCGTKWNPFDPNHRFAVNPSVSPMSPNEPPVLERADQNPSDHKQWPLLASVAGAMALALFFVGLSRAFFKAKAMVLRQEFPTVMSPEKKDVELSF